MCGKGLVLSLMIIIHLTHQQVSLLINSNNATEKFVA